MSDVGYILLHRSAFEHPIFAPEPFTEREAWIWMLMSAAWADTRVRVGKAYVELKRGQLAFSTRFLAAKFQWTDSRVRRLINRLASDAMIDVLTTREATHITICNYDHYQSGRRTDDAQTDAPADAEPTHQRRKEEIINTLNNKNTIGGADAPTAEKKSRKKPARPMPDIFPMSETHREYAERRGYKYEIPPCFAFNKTRPGPAQEMFAAFKNHHAAKGSMFADWDAAWRTWVDNQAKWDTQRGKPPGLRPAI